jgi:hypothetical protein
MAVDAAAKSDPSSHLSLPASTKQVEGGRRTKTSPRRAEGGGDFSLSSTTPAVNQAADWGAGGTPSLTA